MIILLEPLLSMRFLFGSWDKPESVDRMLQVKKIDGFICCPFLMSGDVPGLSPSGKSSEQQMETLVMCILQFC